MAFSQDFSQGTVHSGSGGQGSLARGGDVGSHNMTINYYYQSAFESWSKVGHEPYANPSSGTVSPSRTGSPALQIPSSESQMLQLQPLIAALQQQGMSQPEIIATLLKFSRPQDPTNPVAHSPRTLNGHVDPSGNFASTVLNTSTASSGFVGRVNGVDIPSPPQNTGAMRSSSTSIPKPRAPIAFVNNSDLWIMYRYTEEGEQSDGYLKGFEVATPTELLLNMPYLFRLQVGRTVRTVRRIFSEEGDFDPPEVFDPVNNEDTP
ncbi:hypothetical protein CVT26_004211 [Gymnopilus dilepis]|uniref:Uncharacterized protein n=1 Tax=Gymnopilus dilepis TaxID=231916 RepID=A0A409YMQ7_9AGAR|nr:hypothetical protein CVT26_004211 [Gymnopilus dilepis]